MGIMKKMKIKSHVTFTRQKMPRRNFPTNINPELKTKLTELARIMKKNNIFVKYNCGYGYIKLEEMGLDNYIFYDVVYYDWIRENPGTKEIWLKWSMELPTARRVFPQVAHLVDWDYTDDTRAIRVHVD
jgi:hypothetical protein